jgi:hypothetical protein
MTAPYKRMDEDDQIAAAHRRVRTIEANRSQPDGLIFNWAQNPTNENGPDKVVSYGGTDPEGISLTSGGLVLDNLGVICECDALAVGGFSAGTGSQYLIPLGQSPLWEYVPGFFAQATFPGSGSVVSQVLGVMISYDDSAGLYTTLYLRVSPIDYLGDGSAYVEAYDPTNDSLWGPAYPYTWASPDIMLNGNFTYTLANSLIDTIGS